LLLFDEKCRRFSDMDGTGFTRRYGWESELKDEVMPWNN